MEKRKRDLKWKDVLKVVWGISKAGAIMNMPLCLVVVTVLVVITSGIGEVSAATTISDVMKSLEGLSRVDREARLIAGAKNEGGVMLYSSFGESDANRLVTDFQKKYSFTKAQSFRSSSSVLVEKILAEGRAKQSVWDVCNVGTEYAKIFKDAGLLAPYKSPLLADYNPKLHDAGGYWTGMSVQPIALAYNTNLVPPKEAPKNYQDLLDPKWKNKFSITDDDYVWYYYILKTMGQEKGSDFLKKLAANSPRMIKGRTTQLNLITAGEFPIAATQIDHNLFRIKYDKKAPVDYTYIEPILVYIEALYMNVSSAHPYTAVLFMDWMMSREGQQVLGGPLGRAAALTKGVTYNYPDQGKALERNFMIIYPEEMTKVEDIIRSFNRTFGLR